MDDKWGLPKVILLLLVVIVWVFASVQIDRSQEEMIGMRKHLEGQAQTLQELSVSQKQILKDIKKLKKSMSQGVVVGSNSHLANNPDPADWVPDGYPLSHGKNCLLAFESLPNDFPQAQESDELNLVLDTDFQDLNRLLDNSADLQDISELTSRKLYSREFMQDGEKFYGSIAKAMRITDDYKTYTFELRDDFYWHMPAVDLNDPKFKWLRNMGRQQVTAHDYVFYVKHILLNPDAQCDVTRSYYEKLKGIEALDDFTLRVTWKEKNYTSLEWSALPYCVPEFLYGHYENGKKIPLNVIGEEFNRHWYNDKMIGCGPYRFISYEKGKRIILERDDSYPFRQPHFKRIVYHIVKNPDQQLARFLRGEIDFIMMRSNQYASQIHRIMDDPQAQKESPFIFSKQDGGQFIFQRVLYPGYSYVGWNQNREMFQDKKVRTALSHAMPVRKMLKDVWMGLGSECTGPISMSTPAYDKNLKLLPFDLNQAAQLLDEAQWIDRDGNGIREKKLSDGKVHELKFQVMHFSPLPEYDQMFAIYRQELKKIGVDCKGLGLDWPNMIKRLEERNFDAVAMAWLMPYVTDPYQIWHSSQKDNPKGSNRTGFDHPEVDEIIMKGRKTFDPNKRKELFRRWHHIFYDEQPYTIWRGLVRVYAWHQKLGGVRFDARRPIFNHEQWWEQPQN